MVNTLFTPFHNKYFEATLRTLILSNIQLKYMGTTLFLRKKMNHFPNGWMLILAFFLLGTFLSFSQTTTIWSENFNYGNGISSGTSSGPSASNWNTTGGSKLSVNSNRLRGRNLDAERTWQVSPINISGYDFISFSMDTWVGDPSEMENGSDYLIGEYRIDGGSWQQFVTLDPIPTL